jgi:hypothetical protein
MSVSSQGIEMHPDCSFIGNTRKAAGAFPIIEISHGSLFQDGESTRTSRAKSLECEKCRLSLRKSCVMRELTSKKRDFRGAKGGDARHLRPLAK